MSTWEQAFNSRTDLKQYDDNALGLFALALRFGLDDLDAVAADSITDGSDDKKCDIVHIDPVEGYAVLAQCYRSSRPRASAPANKASDLNTGISWLLQRREPDLPRRLRPAARALRQAITDGSIRDLHVWYVHNLPESTNVKDELVSVEHTLDSALNTHFPDSKIRVTTLEVGTKVLEEWYTDTQSPILVSNAFDIHVPSGFEVSGDKWKAYVTTVPGQFLYDAYRRHGTKLFSANVREYLGSRRSDANINNGIKRSASDAPSDFWVYNNGLTILVHSYRVPSDANNKLRVTGLSIVNGAQTTGALGTLSRSPAKNVQVPVRFVVTTDKDTIFDIIQYNNSQNKVTASDFRSRDRIQRRLREEIGKIPHAEYQGGRRGGASDVIRRNPDLLPSYTVGQAIAAVQGDPEVAYNQKSDIWASDNLYSRYFDESTTGGHIVFAYSLLRCIEARKASLVAKSKNNKDELTADDAGELEYFRQRGSTYMLTAAIAGCLETILSRKVTNLSKLSLGRLSPHVAQKAWGPIVTVCSSFCPQLQEAFADGLKNKERIRKTLGIFQSLVKATARANQSTFREFSDKVKRPLAARNRNQPVPNFALVGNQEQ